MRVGDARGRPVGRLLVHPARLVGRHVGVERDLVLLAVAAGERALPVQAGSGAPRVGAHGAQHVEIRCVEAQPPAQRVRLPEEAVLVARQHVGDLALHDRGRQALVADRVELGVGADAEALDEGVARQHGVEVRHLEVGQVGGGAGVVEVEAITPGVVVIELAACEDEGLRLAPVNRAAGIQRQRPVVEPAPVVRRHLLARSGGDLGRDGHVLVRVDRPVVGCGEEVADMAGVAEIGHQETARAPHGRVGVREVRQVGDRQAEHVERRVMVLKPLVLQVPCVSSA